MGTTYRRLPLAVSIVDDTSIAPSLIRDASAESVGDTALSDTPSVISVSAMAGVSLRKVVSWKMVADFIRLSELFGCGTAG